MEGFTIVDGGVAVIILFSAILAYSRGFVREALAIAGWIAAAVLAYIFAPQAEPLVREIPVLSDFLDNCTASTIAAFAGVFALALIVFALFTPVFSSLVQRSALNAIDQGLGFLFGVLRGMLLVVIALVIYEFAVGAEGVDMVDQSRSAQVFASMKDSVSGEIADQETALAWLTDKFESLIDQSCGAGSAPVSEPAPTNAN
ncbi:CvpA family protein [Aliiruegeria lutimaris]|uniref:Membrane protein required for colicin V production n=1 Tax=Aliiruegeria lutimaris TaxID=571298 RepID=A0A1G8LDS9_9RHOB|nr:CvpA family protein [Aliiruegeria lutimaris]SDI53868.1 membrane protein required for colicin V production [Aliiruegeria lutimaris]